MTREVKIGSAVAGSFLSLVGIVVGTKMYKGEVPKNLDGAIAAITDAKKDVDAPKPPSAAPGLFPPSAGPVALMSGDLPPGSIPPPPNGFGASIAPPSGLPVVPPAPPGGEIGFPSVPAAIVDPAKDVAKNLVDQTNREQQALREIAEKKKTELANAGATLIDGGKKSLDDFSIKLQDKSKDVIGGLPGLPTFPPNQSETTLPPVSSAPLNLAADTIVNGGKKPNPPAEMPLPPPTAGTPPPPAPPTFGGPTAVPEVPKTIIGGSTPPAPPLAGGLPGIPDSKLPAPPAIGGLPTPSAPKDPFGPAPTDPARTIVGGNPTPIKKDPFEQPKPPTVPFGAPDAGNPAFGGLPPMPPSADPFAPGGLPKPPDSGFQPTPASDPFGNKPPSPPFGAPPTPPLDPIVAPAPPANSIAERYQCQGNENYAMIAARKYGNENLARSLEEFNRDLPGAPENLRAQPPRLQPGTIVYVPPQNTLTERYGRFITTSGSPFAAPTPPMGNEFGLSKPTPFTPKNNPQPPAAADAGVTSYRVPTGGMYLSQVAERQLGSALRWIDIYRLNPSLQPEQPLREGMEIRVPVK